MLHFKGIIFLFFIALTTGSKCPQETISRFVVCYYKGETPIKNLNICNCTHLVFTNAVSKTDNSSLILDEDAKNDLRFAKEKKDDVLTLFTLDAKEEESSFILKSWNRSQEVIDGVTEFLQKSEFDGVELNFKFSSQDGASKDSYASFVKDLSKTLSSSHRRVKREGYDVVEKLQDDVTTASYSTQSPKNSTSQAPSIKEETPKSNRTTREEKSEDDEDENDFLTLEEDTTKEIPQEEKGEDNSNKFLLFVRLAIQPEIIAKKFDLKLLSKYADALTVPTHHIVNKNEEHLTYHPSRLMGLSDILNTDSILDFLTGMGALKSKIVISMPASVVKFQLKDETKNTPRSPSSSTPQIIDQSQLCLLFSKNNWTLERDDDLTAPYAFSGKTWLAFEDEVSVKIKGKYILLRELAGGAIYPIDADVNDESCTNRTGSGGYLTGVLFSNFKNLARKPRALVLESLQEEIHDNSFSTIEAGVKLSEYRIVRVVDHSGAVHVIRKNTKTQFECSRQGYFSHPLGCNKFYRCVKFDQYSDEFTVFEYDCPAGLAFDERWEVCVWPGSLPHGAPCTGSSEIAPVPRSHYQCPNQEGYYADPENCRWFFACLDHARDGVTPLTAYEFRCPFGLVFNQEKLACDWPWIVGACGSRGASGYVAAQTVGSSTGIHSATFINGGNLEASFGQYSNFGEGAAFDGFGRGFGKVLKESNGNYQGAQSAGFGYIASQFDDNHNRAPFASLPDYEISGGRILNKGGVVLDQHVNFGSGATGAGGRLNEGYRYQSLDSEGGFGGKSSSSNTHIVGSQTISSYPSKGSIGKASEGAFRGEGISLSTPRPFSVHVPSVQINEENIAGYSVSSPASEASVFGSGDIHSGGSLGISVTQPTVSVVTQNLGTQNTQTQGGFSFSTPSAASKSQGHRFGQLNFGSTTVNLPSVSDSGSGVTFVTPQTVNQGYKYSSSGLGSSLGVGQSDLSGNSYSGQPAVTASGIISGSTPATVVPAISLKPAVQPVQHSFGAVNPAVSSFGSTASGVFSGSSPASVAPVVHHSFSAVNPAVSSVGSTISGVFSGSTPATVAPAIGLKPAIQSVHHSFGAVSPGVSSVDTGASGVYSGSTPATVAPAIGLKPGVQSVHHSFGAVSPGVSSVDTAASRVYSGSTPATVAPAVHHSFSAVNPAVSSVGSTASGVYSGSTPVTVAPSISLKPGIQSVQHSFGAGIISGGTPTTVAPAIQSVEHSFGGLSKDFGAVYPGVSSAGSGVFSGSTPATVTPVVSLKPTLQYVPGKNNGYSGSGSSVTFSGSSYEHSTPATVSSTPVFKNTGLHVSVGQSSVPVVTPKPSVYSFEQTKSFGIQNGYGTASSGLPKSGFGIFQQSSIDQEISRELGLNKPVSSYALPATPTARSNELSGSVSFATPKPQVFTSSQPTAFSGSKSFVTPKYQSGVTGGSSTFSADLPTFAPKTLTAFESTKISPGYLPVGSSSVTGTYGFSGQGNEISGSGPSVSVNFPKITSYESTGSGVSYNVPNTQAGGVSSSGSGILVSSPVVTTTTFENDKSGHVSGFSYTTPSITSGQGLGTNTFSLKTGQNEAFGSPVGSINLAVTPKTVSSVEHSGDVGVLYSSPQATPKTVTFGYKTKGISLTTPTVPSFIGSFGQTQVSGVDIPLASPKPQINTFVSQGGASYGVPKSSFDQSDIKLNQVVQPQPGRGFSFSNFKESGSQDFSTYNQSPKPVNFVPSGKSEILTHVSIEKQPIISVGTISSVNFDEGFSTPKPLSQNGFTSDRDQINFKSSYSVQPKQVVTVTTPAPVVSITPSTQVFFKSTPQPAGVVKTVSAQDGFGNTPKLSFGQVNFNQNPKVFTPITTQSTFQDHSNAYLPPVTPKVDLFRLKTQSEGFGQQSISLQPGISYDFGKTQTTGPLGSSFGSGLNKQTVTVTTARPLFTQPDFSSSGEFNSFFESTKTYLPPVQSTTAKPDLVIQQQPVQLISQKTFGQKPSYEQTQQNAIYGSEEQTHFSLGTPRPEVFEQKQYLPPVTQKPFIPSVSFTTVRPTTTQQPSVYSQRIVPVPSVKQGKEYLPPVGVFKQPTKTVFVDQFDGQQPGHQDINLLYPVTTQASVTPLTEEVSIQQNTNFDFRKVKGGQSIYVQPGTYSTPKTAIFVPSGNQNFSFASGFKYSINPNIEIPEPPQEYLQAQNIFTTRRPVTRVYRPSTTLGDYQAPTYLPPGGSRKTVISVGSADGHEDNIQQLLDGGFGDVVSGNNGFVTKVINGEGRGELEFGREGSSSTVSYEVTTAKPRQRGRGRQYHSKLTSGIPATNKYEEYEIEKEGQRSIGATDSTKTTIDLKNLKVDKNKKTVIVVSQVSDANPILIGKLAGQCSCQSNMLEVRGKGRKSGRGKSQGYQQPPANEYQPPNEATPETVVIGGAKLDTYQPEQSIVSSTTAAYPDISSPSILSSLSPDGVLPITPKLFSEDGIRNKKKQFRGKTRYLPPTPGLSADGIPLSPVLASDIASTVDYNVLRGDESRTQNEIGGGYPGAAFDRYGPGGWRGFDETLQGSVDCKRPGLFRHPKYCNKFYACNYDPWKERYTLHVFNCPIHLTYDSSISACNWPIRGPACADDNLLV